MSDKKTEADQALLASVLDNADNPAMRAILAEMAEEEAHHEEEPDDDDGPVNEEARKRVQDWIMRKVRERK